MLVSSIMRDKFEIEIFIRVSYVLFHGSTSVNLFWYKHILYTF